MSIENKKFTGENIKEYSIIEYNALMGKLDRATRDLHISEVTFFAALGILYTWILKDGYVIYDYLRYILIIPVMISIMGISRILARFRYIEELENYVKKLENFMFSDDNIIHPGGWENSYAKCSRKTGKFTFKKFRIFMWVLLVLLTALVSVLTPFGTEGAGLQVGSETSMMSNRTM